MEDRHDGESRLRAGAPVRPTPSRHVELTWLEKRIEHWIRFGRDVGETILDRRRRVLSFAPNSDLRLRPLGLERLRHGRLAHRHRARDRAGRGLSDAALRPSRRRDPAAHQRLAQGRARARRRSTPSRRSASIRPTPRPITGGIVHNRLVAGDAAASLQPRPASRLAPAPEDRCHDALRLRHDDVFRRARHRRYRRSSIRCRKLIWNASASVPIGLYAVHPAGALHVTELRRGAAARGRSRASSTSAATCPRACRC